MKTSVTTDLPEDLLEQAQAFIDDGWAASLDELIADSLRRFLETHGPDVAESFVNEDVAWGLRGES